MADTKYKLRYLPLFYEDLEQKVVYIAENLHNQKAASRGISTTPYANFTPNDADFNVRKIINMMWNQAI